MIATSPHPRQSGRLRRVGAPHWRKKAAAESLEEIILGGGEPLSLSNTESSPHSLLP
jgi:hypothetical protein